MKPTYEEKTNAFGETIIVATYDNRILVIPADTANSDYQRYLRWLENPNADDTQGGIN